MKANPPTPKPKMVVFKDVFEGYEKQPLKPDAQVLRRPPDLILPLPPRNSR